MANALEAIGRSGALSAVSKDLTNLAVTMRDQEQQDRDLALREADAQVKQKMMKDKQAALSKPIPIDTISGAFSVPAVADYAKKIATSLGMIEEIDGVPTIRAGNARAVYDILHQGDNPQTVSALTTQHYRGQLQQIREQIAAYQQKNVGKDLTQDKNFLAMVQASKQAQQGLMASLENADKLQQYTGLIKQGYDPKDVQKAMETGDMSLLGKPAAQEKLPADVSSLKAVLGRMPTLDELNEYRRSGASQTSIGTLTPAQKKVDEGFAKEYVDWRASGAYADTQKNLKQLNEVLDSLKSGENLTGAVVGSVPDWAQKFINPEAISVRNAVEEVVQRNLRLILGAQFTEKEGERLIDRAYNPKLSEEENAKRVQRLFNQISAAAQAKNDASDYYEKNGTLKGWQGKNYTIKDFESVLDAKAPQQAIDYLKAHPEMKDAFKQKYGYLPEGI